jgi:ADP-ribose pyrophosphatase
MSELPLRKILASGKYLRLIGQGHWEFAERVNATGAVVVVAATDDGKLLLVEQFRIPVGCNVIELPAGLVGDVPEQQPFWAAATSPDRSPHSPLAPCGRGVGGEGYSEMAETAKRELLEETGYEAATVRLLGGGPVSAGLSNEIITFFAADGLKRAGAGGGVDGEQIIVHEIRPDDLSAWLKRRASEGLMIDPKIFAGLWLRQHG